MIAPLAVLTVVVLGASTHTDTTFNVKAGTHLELSNFAGEIAVENWARNAVRVEAEHSSRAWVRIEQQGPALSVEFEQWRGIPTTVDYHLTVPKWMRLSLSDVNTEIGVRKVYATSVEGSVSVTGAQGKLECNSVNSGVEGRKVTGTIMASRVNGEIPCEDIDSDDVEASTINGEFSSAVPVQLSETRRGRGLNFTLDDGSARLEQESFQGEIRLCRPGDADGGIDHQDEYKKLIQEGQKKHQGRNSAGHADETDQP